MEHSKSRVVVIGVACVGLAATLSSCDSALNPWTWPWAHKPREVKYVSPEPVNEDLATCTLTADKLVYAAGEVPVLSVSVTNASDGPITLVKELALMGLLAGSQPRGWFEITAPSGEVTQGLWTQVMCSTGAGLVYTDVVELAPGESINPIWEKVHEAMLVENGGRRIEHRLVEDHMATPGTYALRYVYSTAEGGVREWYACNPKELPRDTLRSFQRAIDGITRVLVYSNPVTITLQGPAPSTGER